MSATSQRRVQTGVPGFDRLVEGGLFEGRLYVVSGPPGSGKTTFSTQFLVKGALEGKTCFFLSMHETKQELVNDMSRYEFGLDRASQRGRIEFLNVFSEEAKRILFRSTNSTGQSNPDALAKRIVAFADSQDVDRVVIDSMMMLEHFFKDANEDVSRFLTRLKKADATVILISEMTDPSAYTKEHYLGHGVIFLHNYLGAGGMQRGIQIAKMRGTAIDCDIRPVRFTESGMVVDADTKLEA
jgi:KaiC/GvpD/RAD55 family RecA-like ATPase